MIGQQTSEASSLEGKEWAGQRNVRRLKRLGLGEDESHNLLANVPDDELEILEHHFYVLPDLDYHRIVARLKDAPSIVYLDIDDQLRENFLLESFHNARLRVGTEKVELFVEGRNFYDAWHLLYDYIIDTRGRHCRIVWYSGNPRLHLDGSAPPNDIFPMYRATQEINRYKVPERQLTGPERAKFSSSP